METFLKDKKINVSVFILIVVVSLFTIVKLVNEIRTVPEHNYTGDVISVSGSGEVLAVSDIASLYINLNKTARPRKKRKIS